MADNKRMRKGRGRYKDHCSIWIGILLSRNLPVRLFFSRICKWVAQKWFVVGLSLSICKCIIHTTRIGTCLKMQSWFKLHVTMYFVLRGARLTHPLCRCNQWSGWWCARLVRRKSGVRNRKLYGVLRTLIRLVTLSAALQVSSLIRYISRAYVLWYVLCIRTVQVIRNLLGIIKHFAMIRV